MNSMYEKYLAWRRLTRNGQKSRHQMSPQDQAAYDALGITEAAPPDSEEAKRAYREVTSTAS
jgi:hypothetical protein